jgi:hypothetical protein
MTDKEININLNLIDDEITFTPEADESSEHLDDLFSDRMEPGTLREEDLDQLCPPGSYFSDAVEFLIQTEHFSRQEAFLLALSSAMIAASGRYVVKNRRGKIMSNASWMLYGTTSSNKTQGSNFVKSVLPKIKFVQYEDTKGGVIREEFESYPMIGDHGSSQSFSESLWFQHQALLLDNEYQGQLETKRSDVTNLESFILEFFGYHDVYISSFKNAKPKIKSFPLHAPALSSIVSVQPEIFLKKVGRDRFENGQMSRYAFVFLDKKAPFSLSMDGVDWGLRKKELRLKLSHLVDSDRTLDYTTDQSENEFPDYLIEIPVIESAFDLHFRYREAVHKKLVALDREGSLDYIQKYMGEYPYKIAIGLCVGMSSGHRRYQITQKIMELSCKICSYFAHNLLSIIDEMQGSSLPAMILQAIAKGGNKFTTPREMRRASSRLSRAISSPDLKMQCLDLVKKGLLVPDETGGKFRAK